MSSFIVRVYIPEVDVNKTVKVLKEDTVWGIKLSVFLFRCLNSHIDNPLFCFLFFQLINKLSHMLPNAHNYTLYMAPTADHEGGFLEDHRLMIEYNLPNNTALLFKLKAREVMGVPEKQLQKWNNKKSQKEFIEWIRKKGTFGGREDVYFPILYSHPFASQPITRSRRPLKRGWIPTF